MEGLPLLEQNNLPNGHHDILRIIMGLAALFNVAIYIPARARAEGKSFEDLENKILEGYESVTGDAPKLLGNPDYQLIYNVQQEMLAAALHAGIYSDAAIEYRNESEHYREVLKSITKLGGEQDGEEDYST
jgi:hypothetical protein